MSKQDKKAEVYVVEGNSVSNPAALQAYLNGKFEDGLKLVAVTGSPNGHVFIFERGE